MIVNIAGWIGTVMALAGWALLATGVWTSEQPWIYVNNMISGILLAWTSRVKNVSSLFWLNAIWAVLAVGGLVRLWLR